MKTISVSTVPAGYRADSKGHLVPESMIRPIDLERDALVQGIVNKARTVKDELVKLRTTFFADIAAFVQLSAELHDSKIGGDKGNVTLTSFDGRYKVLRAIQETLVFDERLLAAKALIESCLQRWSQGAQPEVQVLINDAFQVDQAGNINTGRVLGLRRLPIKDDEWQRAMTAIGEALQVTGSKSYVRIYERDVNGEYKAITLDLAGA
jgi:hypothetical protein